jgi:hypothetical protein
LSLRRWVIRVDPIDLDARRIAVNLVLGFAASMRRNLASGDEPGEAGVTQITPRVLIMSDTTPDYLVSLGIIAAGIAWIVAGTYSTASDLCVAIGSLTIAVGSISFMVEFRNRTH